MDQPDWWMTGLVLRKNSSKVFEYNLGSTNLTICFHFVMIYKLGYFQNLALGWTGDKAALMMSLKLMIFI